MTKWVALLLPLSALPTMAAEYPQASITNGVIQATLNLPSADHGHYRGVRFDWSGVIARLEYAGHNYFGVWFPNYEPTLHDAITGPVEEFRSSDGALGYAEARPGGMFVKIGVGVLRKPDNSPYNFTRNYPIVSNGLWIVRPSHDRVEFVQELKNADGYSYVYTKKVRFIRGKPQLILEHMLKNTSKRPIDTEVYNHDFYVIDAQPTGPGFSIRFPFVPKPTDDLKGDAEVRGNDLVYLRQLEPGSHRAVASYIEGFSGDKKDNDIRVENHKIGAGVRQTIDRPISKLYLWSVRTTICPEAYIALHVPPGKRVSWRVKFEFYKLPPS